MEPMTDAEMLQQFVIREQRWLQTLTNLRAFHESQMGKAMTGIQWIGGREFGRISWFGYYWHQEMFWFGFGLHDGTWRPLIEADNRSKHSDVWQSMRTQLCGTWESVTAEGNLYQRLWAPPGIAEAVEPQLEWFKERSRELHEYAVQADP